ncbi:hypothetical protein [Marinicella sp. W31]|uniref:hypothetical protein n=1 Tax=Marinicella sp. W31 TaxID=3023713 RepID=UPI003757A0A1
MSFNVSLVELDQKITHNKMMGLIRATLLIFTALLLCNTVIAAPKACPDYQLLALNKHLQDSEKQDANTQVKQQNKEPEVAETQKSDPQDEPQTTKATQKKSGASKFKGLFDSLIPSNLKNNSNK